MKTRDTLLATIGLTCLSSAAWATCPPGTRPGIQGCIDGGARAIVRSVRSETRTSGAGLSAPDDKLRDVPSAPRKLEQIRYSLLILELQRLERVVAVTPRKAPDRPTLLRRLAEGYAELAAIADRNRVQAEIRAEHEQPQRASPAVARPPKKTVF
jgi:hypothetical protein